jgi:hypothetical protein
MIYSITHLAAFGFVATVQGHMIMNTPQPFNAAALNNSPLDGSGSDFPCKFGAAYSANAGNTPSTSMAIGSIQPLKFTGGATHGGGSCQISVTYDKIPTKSSVFKVIHSIEGGCPAQGVAGNAGNDAKAPGPTDYTFPIPDIPTGDAVIAWTWFNKIGNREMYMNCAPVTIAAGSAKRHELEQDPLANATQLVQRDQAKFNALPDMFVANIGNGCKTEDSADVLFPSPGDSVTSMGAGAYKAPVGCAAGTAPTNAPASGGSASSAAPVASATPTKLPGGVFVTVSGSPPAATSQAPAPTSEAPAPTSVAPAPTGAAPAPTSEAPAPAPTSVAPAAPAAPATGGSGGAMTGPCSTEGMWNCVGGSSFQQCASGAWSVVQQMAAGTSCTAGQSSSLSMKAIAIPKRALRFNA